MFNFTQPGVAQELARLMAVPVNQLQALNERNLIFCVISTHCCGTFLSRWTNQFAFRARHASHPTVEFCLLD
jgi:hypothetical protein